MKTRLKQPLAVVGVMFGILLPVVGIGGSNVHTLVAASFQQMENVDRASRYTSQLLRYQLDQETGVRGFAATGKAIFLDPYFSSHGRMNDLFDVTSRALSDAGVGQDHDRIERARDDERQWNRAVALPLIESGHRGGRPDAKLVTTEYRGKKLVDAFRGEIEATEADLTERRESTAIALQQALDRATAYLFSIFAGVAALGVVALVIQARFAKRLDEARLQREEDQRRAGELHAELAVKHHIAETLQQALSQRPLPALPSMHFSAFYSPAADEANIGGDWYDAIELPNQRVLLVIGDVAGHGIEASVGMSRARQEFSSAALRSTDPAEILAAVNAALIRQGSPMVTAVCGIVDALRYEFTYASAGHPPPLLVEPGRTARTLTIGGIPLGVSTKAEYSTQLLQTLPGSTIVLYTDGAIEHSRCLSDGEALLLDATVACLETGERDPAQAIHRRIFTSRKAADDVAIVTMSFTGEKPTRTRDEDLRHLQLAPRRPSEGGTTQHIHALASVRRNQPSYPPTEQFAA